MGYLNLRECPVYLDDIIIFSKTFDEQMKLHEDGIERLKQHSLKLKSSKCVFMQREVEYLGHIVSESGKIGALRSWPLIKMSLVVRKLVFDQVRHKLDCIATEHD